MEQCPRCGAGNADSAKFCSECGAPLTAAAPSPAEQRKRVTVLFCDVVDSTGLGESTDPEALRALLGRYFEAVRAIVERHGGTVEKFIGDAVVAVFGVPVLHEDDALRACRAAVEIRDAMPGLGVRSRIGVNSGEVVTGTAERLAAGDAVNVAARLEQAAAPGEVLLGHDTLRLVRAAVEAVELAPLMVKGKAEPVRAFRLDAVLSNVPVERHLDAPLVGRVDELELLRRTFERAVRERGCHLFTLLGVAGVGKSRLAGEVLGGVDATVLRGRCLSYGEGITYWPLLEALQTLESRPSDERAAAVLEAVQGTSDAQVSPEEIAWAFRKLVEELASAGPVVCVFDDLHWAEPVFLDLVEHVADLSRGFPILLLCMARPELLDSRPGWGGGKLNAASVLLEPLSAQETEILIARLMGDAALDPELTARIGRAADGNPLFVEEMVAMLEEAGADEVAVPPTIQALLAARLDQLPGDERRVLAHGAVEGHVFHRGAVEALGVDERDVHARLAALVRKELVRPTAPQLAGDDGFRFRHLLIRDAAYDALPKAVRAELHERFAYWLATKGAELPELDEIVAWHLEQSVRYRLELGLPVDPALFDQAVERLTVAGGRATTLGAAGAAANFLGRALELLPAGDPRRPELAVGLAESILPAVRVQEADTLLREAEADPRTRAQATLARFEWLLYAKPDEIAAFAAAELPPLMADFERKGDEAGLARAYIARARVHQLAGRHAALVDEALAAVEHARRAGQQRLVNDAATMACWGLAIGPERVAVASRKLDELGELGADSAFFRASEPFTRGYLRMFDGDLTGARELFDEARALYADLGMDVYRWAVVQEIGMVEMRAGNYAEAITQLERASAALEELGENGYRSTCIALLGQALYLDGQSAAAEHMAREALRQSAEIDALNFMIARGVLARVAADAGRLDEAEELARAAVGDARRAEMPMFTAAALATLGQVLLERGQAAEGVDFLERALTVAEAKEDRFEATRLRGALDAAATAR